MISFSSSSSQGCYICKVVLEEFATGTGRFLYASFWQLSSLSTQLTASLWSFIFSFSMLSIMKMMKSSLCVTAIFLSLGEVVVSMGEVEWNYICCVAFKTIHNIHGIHSSIEKTYARSHFNEHAEIHKDT